MPHQTGFAGQLPHPPPPRLRRAFGGKALFGRPPELMVGGLRRIRPWDMLSVPEVHDFK